MPYKSKEQARAYRLAHAEEKKIYFRDYYLAHRQEQIEYHRNYRDTHREECARLNREYRATHKQELKEYAQAYNSAHKEGLKRTHHQYNLTHKEELAEKHKKKNGALRQQLFNRYGNLCYFCKGTVEPSGFFLHHINGDGNDERGQLGGGTTGLMRSWKEAVEHVDLAKYAISHKACHNRFHKSGVKNCQRR